MRLLVSASLCRWLSFVNAQLLIAGPRLRGGTAAGRQLEHAEYTNAIVKRQGNDAADADLVAWFLNPLAVDADVAGCDDGLGKGAAFDQADEEQEAVDPHFFLSLANSAKAWLGLARSSRRGPRRPRHFHASPDRAKPISFINRDSASSSRPIEVASG